MGGFLWGVVSPEIDLRSPGNEGRQMRKLGLWDYRAGVGFLKLCLFFSLFGTDWGGVSSQVMGAKWSPLPSPPRRVTGVSGRSLGKQAQLPWPLNNYHVFPLLRDFYGQAWFPPPRHSLLS